MNGNNSQAEMAREIKLAVNELARTLGNTLRDAHQGLSDRRDMNPDLEGTSKHNFR